MFGNKNIKIEEEKSDLKITTIPKEFYAGANPVVKFREIEEVISVPKKQPELTDSEKAALNAARVAGALNAAHPANIFASKKIVFLGGLVLFLLIVGGASAYYFLWQKGSLGQNHEIVQLTENNQHTTSTGNQDVTPTTTEEVVTTTAVSNGLNIDLPSTLLGFASDYDNDNIADLAEEVFSTDPTDSDTDGDKYPDGHELYYLYNPSGFEPMKLIDSNLVKEYKNNVFNYSVYVPKDWVVGETNSDKREVLFSALNGEYIIIRVYDFDQGQTFSDWLSLNAPTERLSALSDFVTSFNLPGKKRNDSLVYYFTDANKVYVINYHPTDEMIVNYKIVLDVVARSFRLFESVEQTVESEPAPGFVTSTQNIESPTQQPVEEEVSSQTETQPNEQPTTTLPEGDMTDEEDLVI